MTVGLDQVLPRLHTKSHSHPSFHYTTHDHTYLLTCLSLKQSYTGIVHFEVFVRRLRIRIVSEGVSCVQNVVFVVTCFFGCVSLPLLVVLPSMYVCIYHLCISIGLYHLPQRHMMCVHP